LQKILIKEKTRKNQYCLNNAVLFDKEGEKKSLHNLHIHHISNRGKGPLIFMTPVEKLYQHGEKKKKRGGGGGEYKKRMVLYGSTRVWYQR